MSEPQTKEIAVGTLVRTGDTTAEIRNTASGVKFTINGDAVAEILGLESGKRFIDELFEEERNGQA